MPPKAAAAGGSALGARLGAARAAAGLAIEKLREGPSANWEKDEALELLYWVRQVFGFFAGILWAYLQLPGLIGFLGFMAINVSAAMMLYKNVMGLDDDEWENASQDLMQEGMPLSMSCFMVMWVLFHNVFNVA